MIISFALSLALQTAPLTVEVKGVKKPLPQKPTSAAVLEQGKKIYQTRCTMCHGLTGNSDTPVGKALKPPPQRFADALWQARVSDDEMTLAIREGGAAVKKSSVMPAHADLTPADVAAVVAYVRTLRSAHGTASVTVMLADGRDANGAADADGKGNAKVVFPGLSGKATVLGVVDESGNPHCTIEVPEAAGATISCAK
ncbi:MAG: cytochrome c [Deltaproteobacteria bacterium]|nr:cytochrome c [Deltaproteobacteria bacterium]